MKLSRKNASVQRGIHKALASGKALSGLLVGLAATLTGCRERTPANTMGSYPRTGQEVSDFNRPRRAIPGEPPVPQPVETNAASECSGRKADVVMGKTPGRPGKDDSR